MRVTQAILRWSQRFNQNSHPEQILVQQTHCTKDCATNFTDIINIPLAEIDPVDFKGVPHSTTAVRQYDSIDVRLPHLHQHVSQSSPQKTKPNKPQPNKPRANVSDGIPQDWPGSIGNVACDWSENPNYFRGLELLNSCLNDNWADYEQGVSWFDCHYLEISRHWPGLCWLWLLINCIHVQRYCQPGIKKALEGDLSHLAIRPRPLNWSHVVLELHKFWQTHRGQNSWLDSVPKLVVQQLHQGQYRDPQGDWRIKPHAGRNFFKFLANPHEASAIIGLRTPIFCTNPHVPFMHWRDYPELDMDYKAKHNAENDGIAQYVDWLTRWSFANVFGK